MAKAGDRFVITLNEANIDWGMYRHSETRGVRSGEAYIPIPRAEAVSKEIFNSNGTGHIDTMGKNMFRFQTADGLLRGVLKAQGCNSKGMIYAKQFSALGDLRLLGEWFEQIHAEAGDKIQVFFLTPEDIELKKL